MGALCWAMKRRSMICGAASLTRLAELHDRESMAHVLAMFDAELIDPMEIDLDSYLKTCWRGGSPPKKTQIFDIFATYADVARRDQGQAAHKQ
jgi:hypothetical protein